MGDKKTVLIVDDDPDVVSFLSTLLEDNDYNVVCASDGVEGLDKARSEKPDLVSLDITMPEKSGVRLYRELKDDEDLKNIIVVIVTGMPSQFEKFISTRKQVPPPDSYIAKPFKEETFLKTINGFLRN